jgi:hypothetical protein
MKVTGDSPSLCPPYRLDHQSALFTPRNDRVYSHYEFPLFFDGNGERISAALHCYTATVDDQRLSPHHPSSARRWLQISAARPHSRCTVTIDETRSPKDQQGVMSVGMSRITAQRGELAGDHQRAWRGGGQHEAPATLGLLKGELLGEQSTPRDAEDIHLFVPELVEQLCAQLRQRPWTIRKPGRRRTADAGNVEARC